MPFTTPTALHPQTLQHISSRGFVNLSGTRSARFLPGKVRAMADDAKVAAKAASSSDPKFEVVGPEPKRFTVAEGQIINVASAAFQGLMRLGYGVFNAGYGVSLETDDGKYGVLKFSGRKVTESSKVGSFPRPAQPIIIYEFEGCPFCRKVREAVAILDLDVLFYPCPQGGPTFRPEAISKGGKSQFPYLVDPNTGTAMYESDDIIKYLFKTYGDDAVPLYLRLGPITALTCGLAMLPRATKGSRYQKAKLPEQPLVYWGYEGSPFCKIVRERLVELELPHVQRSCARGSPKRQELFDKRGTFQVPYIEDPNTGVAMFESAAIIKYLEDTYAAA